MTSATDSRWLNREGRTPSMSGTLYRTSNPERFAAEIRWYESCLQAKGFSRGPAAN